jgi:N,N'-diacetyllegionaminate synthase
MSDKPLEIQGRTVGTSAPCFIIAEAGVNHNGDPSLARRLIDVAAEAGADAVKFQTFRADRLVSLAAPKARYQLRVTSGQESQYEMLRRLELSEQDHRDLVEHARTRGICFLSTPFDEESADFLDDLGVPAFKIPSGELTNLPFLAHVAGKQKPIIMSVGMASLGECEAAVDAIESADNQRLVLLQCVSNYPADPADVNLRAMRTLHTAFGVPVGYSDHTEGLEVALAAVAMGACVIEKHFTLDRALPGPDHAASIEPVELEQLVRSIRIVESALGTSRKRPSQSEADTAAVARKSLVAACDLPAGAVLTDKLLTARRPGTGLPPAMRPHVLGRILRCPVAAGTPIALEMLDCARLAS